MCAWIYKARLEESDPGDIALAGAILYVFTLTSALKYAVNSGIKDCECCGSVVILLIFVCGFILPLVGCILLIVGGVKTADHESKALAFTAAVCGILSLPFSCLVWTSVMSQD